MTELVLLGESDVAALLDPDELRDALTQALQDLSDGRASAPPRVGVFADAGLLGVMPGYLPGRGMVTKLVSVFPGNHTRGLPSHQALIALFDEADGSARAVMDGTHITTVRTAATAALAAQTLARPDARVLAILGAGVQGTSHLDAFDRIAEFAEIRIASRTREHAIALAERHPRASVSETFEEAVRGADVICCCTNADEPVIDQAWLAPGAHVGSVGTGAELDDATIESARVFVEWRGAATTPPPAGAVELQRVNPDTVTELGEVLAGNKPGRQSSNEITVYKSTGHVVEDVAAVTLVYQQAIERGIGTPFSF